MPLRYCVKIPASRPYLDAALESLVEFNVLWLRRNPGTVRLYDSGVRYKREEPKREEWLMIPELYAARVGDCEDLAGALAAELIVDGYSAEAFSKRTGKKRYHALVAVATNGGERIEDPSVVLGMKKRRRPWRGSQSR